MTIEMLIAPPSGVSPPTQFPEDTVSATAHADVAIPQALIDELSNIIADALIASIERSTH
jgi:hypothetical protein